jgi:hypothetical protein
MKTQATVSQPSAVPGSPLLQVSGALFGIIAFILIAAWLAKRFGLAGKTAGARGLKVSASTTLGHANAWSSSRWTMRVWCWASRPQTSTYYINCRPPLLWWTSAQKPLRIFSPS